MSPGQISDRRQEVWFRCVSACVCLEWALLKRTRRPSQGVGRFEVLLDKALFPVVSCFYLRVLRPRCKGAAPAAVSSVIQIWPTALSLVNFNIHAVRPMRFPAFRSPLPGREMHYALIPPAYDDTLWWPIYSDVVCWFICLFTYCLFHFMCNTVTGYANQ